VVRCDIFNNRDYIGFTTKETDNIFYMHLVSNRNLEEFYKSFNFPVNDKTRVEDIKNNIKVFDVKGFITPVKSMEFTVRNTKGVTRTFKTNNFQLNEDIPQIRLGGLETVQIY